MKGRKPDFIFEKIHNFLEQYWFTDV